MSGLAPEGWPARISFDPTTMMCGPVLTQSLLGGRLRRIGIGVAGVGPAFEHVHQADDALLAAACDATHACDPFARICVEAHRVRSRRVRRVRHAGPAVRALAHRLSSRPSASTVTIDACMRDRCRRGRFRRWRLGRCYSPRPHWRSASALDAEAACCCSRRHWLCCTGKPPAAAPATSSKRKVVDVMTPPSAKEGRAINTL